MTGDRHRDRVESNTLLLDQAQWLLDRAHLLLNLLGDVIAAGAINHIMHDIEAERRRWLRAVDSPLT